MESNQGGRDSRFTLGGYGAMGGLLGGPDTPPDIYMQQQQQQQRPSTSLQQQMSSATSSSSSPTARHHGAATMVSSCGSRLKSDICYDDRGGLSQHHQQQQHHGLSGLDVTDVSGADDAYGHLGQSKKSPPSNGKKTKGRVKIKMEYIENKLRRYTTFSKRKTGIMKKAYELSTLTGTQVMLLVASETGHVYTFATRKLQPMITSEAGKALIQTCLNSPDPPAGSGPNDQRMSATGFEETELTYNISDEDSKVRQLVYGGSPHSHHPHHPLGGGGGQGHYATAHHLDQGGHLGLGGSPQHGGYGQACPSPLPPPHPSQGYGQHHGHPHSHPHSHLHPQR